MARNALSSSEERALSKRAPVVVRGEIAYRAPKAIGNPPKISGVGFSRSATSDGYECGHRTRCQHRAGL